MGRVCDVLDEKREEIVQRFADRLYQTTSSHALKREDVIDSLREFVRDLASSIRLEEGPDGTAKAEALLNSTATEHGRQRFALGFDVGSIVREYSHLTEIIFLVLEESHTDLTYAEARCLSKRMIHGIADAASTYAEERDQMLLRQAAKHVGFLAHELRTPLTSMKLAFGLMQQTGVVPRDHKVAAKIENGLSRLAGLIDHALVDATMKGSVEANLEVLVVEPFLQTLMSEIENEAEARNVRLITDCAATTMHADIKLLHSALSNLLRNAVKFTRDGGAVRLSVKEADGRISFEVADECGGLPEGKTEKLFDPFVQVGKDRSGFGLGLAIAKQAVDAHSGNLRVHDVKDHGCVFIMDMPVHGPPEFVPVPKA